MDVKASSVSEIIIWVTTILAVLLLVMWFFTNFRYEKPTFDLIENDLSKLVFSINDACNAYSFSEKYNLEIEEGTFILDNNKICMYSKGIDRCRNIICDISYKEIDLSKITQLEVKKQNGGEVSIIEH